MRLIDADALKDRVGYIEDEYGHINEEINNMPTIEAEPVVHCKDCRYAHMTYGGECKYCDAWEEEGEMYLDGDFYCAFGERKDDLEKGEVNDWRWMR